MSTIQEGLMKIDWKMRSALLIMAGVLIILFSIISLSVYPYTLFAVIVGVVFMLIGLWMWRGVKLNR